MIELELFIVFFTSIFFTLLYLGKRELVWGIITFGAWLTTSFMWTMINPMSTTYSIALFFQGIAFIFLLMVVIQLLGNLRSRGREESDLD